MPTYAQAVAADLPTVWWRNQDGETGTNNTLALDASGNNNVGHYVGDSTIVAGPLNGQTSKAVSLNGARAIVAEGSLIGFASARTTLSLEAWVKTNSGSAQVACGYDGNGLANLQVGFGDMEDTNDGNKPVPVSPVDGANDNGWHHQVITYSASGANIIIIYYLDGVQAGIFTGTGDGPSSLSTDLSADYFAAGAGVNPPYNTPDFLSNLIDQFSGLLAEAAMYPQALSGARVLAHYTAGTTNPSPPVTAVASRNWYSQFEE